MPEQQQNPLALVGDLMNMKAGMTRIREVESQTRERDEKMKDDAIIGAALKRHAAMAKQNGTDIDYDAVLYDLYSLGRGNAAADFQTRLYTWKKGMADEYKSTLEANKSRLSLASQLAQSVLDSPDPDTAFARVQPQIKDLVGEKYSSMMGPTFDRDVMTQLVSAGRTATEQMAAQKAVFERIGQTIEWTRNAAKDAQDWETKVPELVSKWTTDMSEYMSLATNEEDWKQGFQIFEVAMTGVPTGIRKSIIDKFDPAFSRGAVEKARLLGMTQAQRTNESQEWSRQAKEEKSELDATNLTQASIDMMANQFARTGVLPALGYGEGAKKMKAQIINRASDAYANLNLADQQAAFRANNLALGEMQKMLDAITAFEQTAEKNLNVYLGAAKKMIDAGSPLINRPLRAIDVNLLGSPEQAAVNAARSVIIPEFARIIQNPRLVGQLTDTGRNEIEQILKSDYTLRQVYSVARILLRDARNRKESTQQQINAIRARITETPSTFAPDSGATGTGGNVTIGPTIEATPPADKTQIWNSPRGRMKWDATVGRWVPAGVQE
jgi:hypothetical protein